MLWLIFAYCAAHAWENKVITIARKTFPALRGTALRDFTEILETYGLYNPKNHNKTSSEFRLFGNLVEFISLDQPRKVRGRKRHVLFINEANELTLEDWLQFSFRTTEKIVLDYNPSEEFNYIYDEVLTRDDAELFITTYEDNPFLEESLVREVERLQKISPYLWSVYGKGLRARNPGQVFDWVEVNDLPRDDEGEVTAKLLGTGLDWGYTNDPTAAVEVWRQGDDLYIIPLIYERGLTNPEISDRLKALEYPRVNRIICDNAEPKSLKELSLLGWHTVAAKKGKDSIRNSIDIARRFRLHLLHKDVDLIKEFRHYVYKTTPDGRLTNEPVDLFNHGIDAFRYVLLNVLGAGFGKYRLQ